MNWVKKNLLVLIPLVIALIAVPVMVFFSMKMTNDLKSGVESDLSKAQNDLRGFNVNYSIPSAEPGERGYESNRRPTSAITQAVRERRAAIRDQAIQVRSAAIERNRAGKQLLVDGDTDATRLFPKPIDDSARIRLSNQFLAEWPAAHDRLLAANSIAMPPDAAELTESIQQTREREIERITRGRLPDDLDDADRASLQNILVQQRLGAYRAKASETRIYGDASIFRELGRWLPWASPSTQPTGQQMWEWQEVYWIHQDLIEALVSANTSATGQQQSVIDGAVKRILAINIEPWMPSSESGSGRGGRQSDEMMTQGAGPDGATPIDPDYTWAHSGRFGFPHKPNGLYDVRYATVELILDPLRLPQVIEAINHTNFMTVLEQRASVIPPGSDLSLGFDYGQLNLVEATLRIELVYFREWRVDWMPPEVRQKLGIPEPAASGASDGSDGGFDDGGLGDGSGDGY